MPVCSSNLNEKDGLAFKNTKVLVLTDYSPLSDIIKQMNKQPSKDWAEVETENFVNATNLWLTGNNILQALFKIGLIAKIRAFEKQEICSAFSRQHLLLWNYFPFARGGNVFVGMDGLPTDCSWINLCDELLCKFLECVDASDVTFAVNQGVKDNRSRCFGTRYKAIDLSHPSSWRGNKRLRNEGKEFRNFLSN
jgi:hypothetical protein